MGVALNVNQRGSVTIPRALREVLGVLRGGLVSAEIQDGKVTLRAARLTPYRVYSDAEIVRWQKEDSLNPGEAVRLRRAIRKVGPRNKARA